jgi:hypothetical protein
MTCRSRRIMTDYGATGKCGTFSSALTLHRLRGAPAAEGLPSYCAFFRLPSHDQVLTGCQGYTEVRYDEERKRVVYEPLQLSQAFRSVVMRNNRDITCS